MPAVGSLSLDSLNLHKLLRKNSINRAVAVLKIVCFVLMGVCAVVMGKESVENFFGGSEAIDKLTQAVELSMRNSTKVQATKPKDQDYQVIATKNLFGPITPRTAPTPIVQAKPVNLTPLSLIGTFIEDEKAPYAIVEEGKKSTQDVYNINDMIAGEAKVIAIFNDRIDIMRNNQVETLTIDDTPNKSAQFKEGVAQMDNDEFFVEEAELDKALENLPLLLTQARAVPYFKDGKSIGLRLFAIRAGSLFEKIGLMNGDILKTVNESSLADFSQALSLFEKLKQEKSIKVQLERNKQEREFKYTIK